MADRQPPTRPDDPLVPEAGAAEVVRSEEELRILRYPVERGRLRVLTDVDTEHVEGTVDRAVEHAVVEHTPPFEEDDGRVITLADGSMSIPVLEEELVVTTRWVVRERIVIRKDVQLVDTTVGGDVRRQHLRLEVPEELDGRVHGV